MNRLWRRSERRVFRALSAIALAFLILFSQSASGQTKPDPKKSEAIRRALSEIVAAGKAPGMIAAIISSRGVLAIGSAGVRKAGSAATITNQDLVHLGSCTKAMTAVMIATLIAEGKLGWDTKLADAIPELKKGLHPDYRGVTLWQLLTHRAGVPNNPEDWGAHKEMEIQARRLAILKDNLARPAATAIGEFNYSNFGYMIAACMAEQITGSSWEALMKKRLFDPLGMTSAGFGEPDAGGVVDQPWGHVGSRGKWLPSRDYDEEALGPAGEIHCTVEDWGKFLALQFEGGNPILDRKHLNKLLEPIGFYAGGWGIIDGLGWAKGKAHTHNGSNGIWFATVLAAPGIDRAFVVATNSRDFVSTRDLCAEMIRKLKELNADFGQI
jgi:CubicO group peptidase (beta-lactamase class C family)